VVQYDFQVCLKDAAVCLHETDCSGVTGGVKPFIGVSSAALMSKSLARHGGIAKGVPLTSGTESQSIAAVGTDAVDGNL